MNKYKLLLLDVDGVLLKSKNSKVSKKVADALISIKNKVYISFCTGRTARDIKELIDKIGLENSYHIVESGAKVLNPSGDEEHQKLLSSKQIDHILKTAGSFPQGYGFCFNGVWLSSVDQIGDKSVSVVTLHSHSKKRTKVILEAIKEINGDYHVAVGSHWQKPNGNFIAITNKEASKGEAIKYLHQKLNLSPDATIGVGDMPNDLPIFKNSRLKIAVGNAHQDLKDQADVIAPSIDDDGVAWIVEEYFVRKNR